VEPRVPQAVLGAFDCVGWRLSAQDDLAV